MEQTNQPDLSQTLNQIINSNPNIAKAILFNQQKTLAADNATTPQESDQTYQAIIKLNQQAPIGEVKLITIQYANGRVDINQVDDYFLTTVASKETTDGTISSIVHNIKPCLLDATQTKIPQAIQLQPIEPLEKMAEPQTMQKAKTLWNPELMQEEPQVLDTEFGEFTVDNMGRLDVISASNNSVRLDTIAVGRWSELYGEGKVKKVLINVAGTRKSAMCTFEEAKESNGEKRDYVWVPDMLQRTLGVKKGQHVLIRPIIEIEPPQEPEPLEDQATEELLSPFAKRSFLPGSPSCQLIVEGVSGFGGLGNSDTVRFDEGLLERWREFLGQQKIEEVIVTDVTVGKSVTCKFKIQKGSKFEGKGYIQIPKAIQEKLAVKEGALVTIQPTVE